MRLKRALIDATDRSVGRSVLATASTWRARRGGHDVQVFYDRAWVHRIDSTYLPVSDRYETRRDWEGALERTLEPIRENWYFLHTPAQGATVVDVGAGDGLDSLVFSRTVGPRGRVLAIEAHPATCVLLEQTVRLNRLGNVTPLQYAVMDRPGTVSMVEAGGHRDEYTVIGNGSAAAPAATVPAATLDELCAAQGVERVDLLKMNIEGAERYALPGAEATLERTSHVCVACHDFMADREPDLATKAFVTTFLSNRGFEVVRRDEHPLPWVRDHVHAFRP